MNMRLLPASVFLSLMASLATPATAQFGNINLAVFVESINTITESFPSNDCAVVELSLGNEVCPYNPDHTTRTLLRFSTGVWNIGPDDMQVDRKEHPELFEWGDCHKHWHFKDFTLYELINEATNETITGRKQAFCLMDIRKMDDGAGPGLYSCSNQGITVGWADIYSYNLDGQWIDITGVPAGSYSLRVSINPLGVFNETSYDDNTVTITSSEDSDLILTGSVCPGGPPPTQSPTVTARPTDAPTKNPTNAPTAFACAVITNKETCQNHNDCDWYKPGGGRCISASGTSTPPPGPVSTPAPTPACANGVGLGQGCNTADECCSSICEHKQSGESKYDSTGRFLSAMEQTHEERELETGTTVGRCVCLVKNSGCTADFQCCSLNCNFSRAKCSGSDLTDPYGNIF